MVTMPARLRALDRKLIRDLWAMKGQSLAIASVIAAGVAMFVMYLSNFDSLQRTRAAYYDSARFADVFASLKRAPVEPRAPHRRAARRRGRRPRVWSPMSRSMCRGWRSRPSAG